MLCKNVHFKESVDVILYSNRASVVLHDTIAVSSSKSASNLNRIKIAVFQIASKAATTVPPYLREPAKGCVARGQRYSDGEAVPSSNPCEHCYCMRDEVVCAVQECKPPCDGCVPIPSETDSCCPERYECCEFYEFITLKMKLTNHFLNQTLPQDLHFQPMHHLLRLNDTLLSLQLIL